MKRKVIQIADSTLLISLPKKWADAHNIKKGDEIFVEPDGPILTVKSDSKPLVETREINLNDFGVMAPRAIFALYKKGIDEIKIKYDNSQDFKIIQESLKNETLGYEVVEQGSNQCIIKNVSGQTEEFEAVLRRIFLLLMTMSSESLNALKNNDRIVLKNIEHLEASNNRLTTICRRYLNKMGKTSYSKIGPLYTVIEMLEKIADEYKYMFKYLGSKDTPPSFGKEFFEIYKETDAMIRLFYETFYKFDTKKLADLGSKRKDLVQRCVQLMEKTKSKEEMMATHHLFVIFQEIFDITGPTMIITI